MKFKAPVSSGAFILIERQATPSWTGTVAAIRAVRTWLHWHSNGKTFFAIFSSQAYRTLKADGVPSMKPLGPIGRARGLVTRHGDVPLGKAQQLLKIWPRHVSQNHQEIEVSDLIY
jgi:hypothetical protein